MNDTYVQDNGDLFSVCNAKRLEDGNKWGRNSLLVLGFLQKDPSFPKLALKGMYSKDLMLFIFKATGRDRDWILQPRNKVWSAKP
jgi:hypothetical protein